MRISEQGILSCLNGLAATDPGCMLFENSRIRLDARSTAAITEHIGSKMHAAGFRQGDLVAFRPLRSVASALMLLGLRRAGVTIVLSDPKQPMEAALQGADTPLPVKAEICQRDADTFELKWTDCNGRRETFSLSSLLPVRSPLPLPSPLSPAFVIFTSGTTGKSKAVVLRESCLVSNLLDSYPLGDYRRGDRALGCLPLHHVFGLVLLCGAVVLGYSVYFPEKTDPENLLYAIQEEKLTRMNGVPALYLALADRCGPFDLRSLRVGFIGGGPITPGQFVHLEEKLNMTLIPVYGMSECIGISCASFSDSQEMRSGGVGRFYPMNTGRILREDDTEAEVGEEGEIWVAGPARMIGYYGRELPGDALFPTGDLGYLDDNQVLHLTGRKKEIIIRNGNNLSLRRIEEALLRLPGVQDTAAVGLPDEYQGEVPAAMVVAPPSVTLTPDLYKHEMPVLIQRVKKIPLTASGKPDRQRIREILAAIRAKA